ncbi:proto-oncogene tyrosine-protein kinase receptor ret [Lasius niger]|uniref:Proto-oncogene tyrosine-protein kinase receptor ret n=1 Tax=Lasius niger TaxID=67767 RepID=A0A0J7KL89_LASNI|nr:proto-oncogene tyrosine-protein kinase receptor ret [Lasius niger]
MYIKTIVDDKLFANASLDRDTIGPPGGPGPRVQIEVRCVVWDEKTGMQYVKTDVLTIDILDQDDNPPTAQGNTSIAITLPDFSEGYKLIDDNHVILKDADAVTSNQYNVRLIGDISHALRISYDTLPIEHPQYPDQAPYTAIVPRFYARKTLLPKSPYHVVLQVTDESLLEGYGANSVSQYRFYVVDTHWQTA